MRLFIAIALNNATKETISDYCKMLKESGVSGNFTSKDNFHITLKFLGETQAMCLSDIKNAVSKAAALSKSFTLHSKECGYFESRGSKTLYITVFCDELSHLFSNVDASLSSIGFPKETRKFIGHITVARKALSDNSELPSLTQPKLSFNVDSITLFESRRDNNRLWYKPLFTAKLN